MGLPTEARERRTGTTRDARKASLDSFERRYLGQPLYAAVAPRHLGGGRSLDALEEDTKQQDREGGDSGVKRQGVGGETGDRARQQLREEDKRREDGQQGGDRDRAGPWRPVAATAH